MLLVVAHPTVGAALHTLLEMEDRYKVLRVQRLDQTVTAIER